MTGALSSMQIDPKVNISKFSTNKIKNSSYLNLHFEKFKKVQIFLYFKKSKKFTVLIFLLYILKNSKKRFFYTCFLFFLILSKFF